MDKINKLYSYSATLIQSWCQTNFKKIKYKKIVQLNTNCYNIFDLQELFEIVDIEVIPYIQKIYNIVMAKNIKLDKLKSTRSLINEDILLVHLAKNKKLENALTIGRILRTINMVCGELHQIAIGNFIGWTDLSIGHLSGLDLLHTEKKIIIELKNKYNTMNSSTKTGIHLKFDKLKNKSSNYSNHTIYLAHINCKIRQRDKTSLDNGKTQLMYTRNKSEYYQSCGQTFLDFVYTYNNKNYSNIIITILQKKLTYEVEKAMKIMTEL